MVCTTNDLSSWKDFPKGLSVLLLDEDNSSAAEIKSKLEALDYIVYTFCNENEALSAISNEPGSFHVAIVEVSTSNSNGSFKFLETAKDLPTIMTSNIHCLNTMMKCIALGAVEFLRKPLSEDKLRNIWQHVVHKAFNTGGNVQSKSLKPVKDSIVSMLELKVELEENEDENMEKTENASLAQESNEQQSPASDKHPAPSTWQFKQVGWLLDDGDCQDHINFSVEKDSGEQEGESKSVETTCTMSQETLQAGHPPCFIETVIKETGDLTDGAKSENNIHPNPQNKDSLNHSNDVASDLHTSNGTRANRKKMKKYRMRRRPIFPKEDDRRWPHHREQVPRSYYPYKPIMAYPPYHSKHDLPTSPVYPMWGATGSHTASMHTWGTPSYLPWPPTEIWHRKPYLGMHADAWGCPVMPPLHSPFSSFPQNASGFQSASMGDNSCGMPQKSFDLQPAEEVINKVVKEVINKPWLPLPIGLKPPSTDSVLAELSRQGISSIPPLCSNSF
ncbi:two-component response regulator-like APRR2 isoform X3 [Populus alba x Populus x berolinensis]|nr:two-component response regulator-like APRR2 isoform X3 [Populus alba x Populus x berolinensis]